MRRQHIALLWILSSGLMGCHSDQSVGRQIQQWCFQRFGSTCLSKVPNVSLKQIHLGRDEYYQQDLVVEGRVKDSDPTLTHLVLDDVDATLLVVTTRLDHDLAVGIRKGSRLKVYGTLDHGKLGLPQISARAVYAVKKTDKNS